MVYLFLADGFEEVEAVCPLDWLSRAGVETRTVAVAAARADGRWLVTGAHGLTVAADMSELDYCDDRPDMVILPGGMPGATHLDRSPVVDRALEAASRGGGWIAAICAAPMVLGKRGYLKGRRATCFPGFERYLEGAVSVGGRVIRDGRLITAVGMGAAQEFACEIVSVLTSPETAGRIRASVLAP